MNFCKKNTLLPGIALFGTLALLASCGGGGGTSDDKTFMVGDIVTFDTQGEGGTIQLAVGGLNKAVVYYAGTSNIVNQTAFSESMIGFNYDETTGFFSIQFQIDKDFHIHAGPSIINRIMGVHFDTKMDMNSSNIEESSSIKTGTMVYTLTRDFLNDALLPRPDPIYNQPGVYMIQYNGQVTLMGQ